MSTRSHETDVSHLLRLYPDTDAGETRAADLATVLTGQGLVVADFWMGETVPGGPAGHCVFVEPAHADRAELVATAFEAEHDSALDYLDARGVEPARPTRGGCGLFWFFPVILGLMGALQLAGVGAGSPWIGAAMLAVALLMIAASWWVAKQDLSDPDDVEG